MLRLLVLCIFEKLATRSVDIISIRIMLADFASCAGIIVITLIMGSKQAPIKEVMMAAKPMLVGIDVYCVISKKCKEGLGRAFQTSLPTLTHIFTRVW